MNESCKNIEKQLEDFNANLLDKESHKEVEDHLAHCSSCLKTQRQLLQLSEALLQAPHIQPSSNLRDRFEDMLNEELGQQETPIRSMTQAYWKQIIRVAAVITLLVTAFLVGKNLQKSSVEDAVVHTKIEEASSQQLAVLSQIENGSASKRVQGVSEINDFSAINSEIIEALISRMNEDDNTNVRLAAVEALGKFSNSEVARKALINSLNHQQIPEVQIAIIQILGNFKEKRAAQPAQLLLEKEDVPSYVKDQVRLQLPNLI